MDDGDRDGAEDVAAEGRFCYTARVPDPETTALVATAVDSLPPVIKANLYTSIGNLISSAVDVPVAWLEGKAKRLRAVTAADIESIAAAGKASAVRLAMDPDIYERCKERFLNDLVRSQYNREAIAAKVEDDLKSTPTTDDADRPIDPDWLDTFSRVAETKSNEEMQTLLARLLAGEIRKPGSFAPATVEVLARLAPDTARSFETFCAISSEVTLVAGDEHETAVVVITAPYGDPGESALLPLGFSFPALCDLQEAGLVGASLHCTWAMSKDHVPHTTIVCGGRTFRFTGPAPAVDEPVAFETICFTRAGTELRRLLKVSPNQKYIERLRVWLNEWTGRRGFGVAES